MGACSYNKTVLKSFPYPITCTTLQVRECRQAVLPSMHSTCLLILVMTVKEQADACKHEDMSWVIGSVYVRSSEIKSELP